MLDCGFPVSATGPSGQTALHWAAWYGWRDAVAVLLAHGAPVAAVEHEFGATPLGWAAHGSDNWPNPEGDYPGVVRLLLAAGADATATNRWGKGMLADDGNPEVADLLRAAGARDEADG